MIEIKIYDNLKDLEGIKDYWQSFQNHPENDFEYFNIIINNRAEIIKPCVLVLCKDNVPITIVVGRVECRSIPIKFGYVKILQPRINTFVIFYKGIIGDNSDDILKIIYNKFIILLRESVFDAIYIDNALCNSYLDMLIRNNNNLFMKDITKRQTVHWDMRLPKSYNEFLMQYNSKQRYWLNRIKKTIIKDFEGKVCIKTQRDFKNYMEIINDIESIAKTTYHRKFGFGFKNNNEYHEMIRYYIKSKSLLVYVLYVNGMPSAYWLGVMFNNKIYFGITGYKPEYFKYEIGTVVLLKIIEDACNVYDEIEYIDFGFGDAYYKQKFGTTNHIENSTYIFKPSFKNVLINISVFIMSAINKFVIYLLKKYELENKVKKYIRRA